MFGQDSLRLCVHERQGVDDDVQDGRGLPLTLHTDQLQEVFSVREGQEDKLRSLAKHPGVVGGQRHLVGVPEVRRKNRLRFLFKEGDTLALCCHRENFQETPSENRFEHKIQMKIKCLNTPD